MAGGDAVDEPERCVGVPVAPLGGLAAMGDDDDVVTRDRDAAPAVGEIEQPAAHDDRAEGVPDRLDVARRSRR